MQVARRMDNGRIDDRARRNADTLGLQMHVHSLQHQTAQIVPTGCRPLPAFA
jgi:hypothetical protein